MTDMPLPPFYALVRILAIVGAGLGCLVGAVSVLGSLSAFNYSVAAGTMAITGGVFTILGSLAGLGVAFCFLAIVKATIETRNAVVRQAHEQGRAPVTSRSAQSAWLDSDQNALRTEPTI